MSILGLWSCGNAFEKYIFNYSLTAVECTNVVLVIPNSHIIIFLAMPALEIVYYSSERTKSIYYDDLMACVKLDGHVDDSVNPINSIIQ